jgi:hypothetical protein
MIFSGWSSIPRSLFCAFVLAILSLALVSWPQPVLADDHTRFFPETGMSVSFGFKRYFEERGGLEVFGYPITPEVQEHGFTVQYFQRARFEYHPEHAGTIYEVQLGLLGDILTSDREFPKAAPVTNTETQRYFPETGHIVSGAFLRFFNTRGGLDIFGYPISEVIQENGRSVQYFQRSRFEYHPQLPAQFQITLGLLGEELSDKVGPRGQFWVTGLPGALMRNQNVNVQIAVQNVGIGQWSGQGPKAVSVGYRWLDAAGGTVLESTAVPLPSLVPAGSVASLAIPLRTPAHAGQYVLQWDLWQEGRGWSALRDSSAATRMKLSVQGPAQMPTPVPTAVSTAVPTAAPQPVITEPTDEDGMIIRVGVFSTTEPTMRISGNGDFRAEDENGQNVRSFSANQIVTVTHLPALSRYRLTLDGRTVAEVANYVRFIAQGNTILRVLDIPQYQQYRQVIEVRYSSRSDRLWAINELPMEYYVKGIGEEPEDFPFEGLKAATVAYRTYALSHMDPQWPGLGCFCGVEPFDLGASHKYVSPYIGSHQWYLGYYRETLGSNLERAANATRGQFITHGGKVIRAAYYSRADGNTRSWQERWGGPGFPWAVAVADPVSANMTLHGHGVGMPLQSTKILAEQGQTYDQMLKMYYTGVELTKLY